MSTTPATLAPLDERQRYTIVEAIRYLRTSRQSIYNLISTGGIATINQGKRRFVPGSEIARLSRVAA
ncbi:MAG TPA: helix-turn-helix domain-containing protein [Steroidobacteraceae bacterium]|jgi:hypothetical protein|nr:helix-turn-helix domain-containing protein [Steroidobacteraceae bacterium]